MNPGIIFPSFHSLNLTITHCLCLCVRMCVVGDAGEGESGKITFYRKAKKLKKPSVANSSLHKVKGL